MLCLNNICKKYANYEVLNFEEWNLESGIHWLQGANGTGKSTLFRIISGQIPFNGNISLNEISLKKQPILYRSKIAFSEAEPQYPLFIRGKELIDYYQEIRQADQKEVDYLTDYFEMSSYLTNKIGSYSTGMVKNFPSFARFWVIRTGIF